MRQRSVLTYPAVLCGCFFCGLLSGTIFVNCLAGGSAAADGLAQYAARRGMNGAAGWFRLWGLTGLTMEQRLRLWSAAARQRLSEFGLAFLVGLTPLAPEGYALLAFAAGCGCGLAVSVLTLTGGLLGLPMFVVSLLPQWLCYLPVWLMLARYAGGDAGRLRAGRCIFLAALAGIGTFFEAYVNPCLLRF